MLQPNDFNNVGLVAAHCDLKKLNIAEKEAYNFDLGELFCDFWDEVIEIWNEIDAYLAELAACEADPECETPPVIPDDYQQKYNLIYGGEFTGCNGKTRNHLGVKAILVYYTYARYVILNGYNDTPTGIVTKTNDFSIPKPLKELEMFADKYRSMGKVSFDKTVGFLCANTEYFTWTDCKKCGCGTEKCQGRTKAKGYGFTSSTISKYDV